MDKTGLHVHVYISVDVFKRYHFLFVLAYLGLQDGPLILGSENIHYVTVSYTIQWKIDEPIIATFLYIHIKTNWKYM